MEMAALRVRLHLPVANVPGLGYQTLLVQPAPEFAWPDTSLISATNRMENAFLRVQIEANGTLTLADKRSGHTFRGLHYFADNGEAGHAWRHIRPCHDRVITTLNSAPTIELLESGPHMARYRVTHTMHIPKRLEEGGGDDVRRLDGDGDNARRSNETEPVVLRSELMLDRFARGVAVKTMFTNGCEDHRLRVMFPTHLAASHSSAEEPFDVVERPIVRGPESPWRGTWNPTHPCGRFVDVSDGEVGLALIGEGLREYEVTDDASRTIGLTLMRAFEVALTTVAWRWERHPEMKGSQVLGDHESRYFIYPHAGDWSAGQVPRQADRFHLPLEPVQAGPHAGALPKSLGFLELAPEELVVVCFKRAEDRESLVVRLYNPTLREIDGSMTLLKKPRAVRYLTLDEGPLDGAPPEVTDCDVAFTAGPKKIITIEISFP